MLTRRHILTATALAAALAAPPAIAQTKIKVVATISILGDLVKNVGGERVDVAAGRPGHRHVYSPTPADVNKLTDAV